MAKKIIVIVKRVVNAIKQKLVRKRKQQPNTQVEKLPLERPLKQVGPRMQELVTKIEVLKGINSERPKKRISPKIAEILKMIQESKSDVPKVPIVPALMTPERFAAIIGQFLRNLRSQSIEQLALDEFFSWAAVPMLQLDEFFSWRLHLEEFFVEQEAEAVSVGENVAETQEYEAENELTKVEEHHLRRCCSLEAFVSGDRTRLAAKSSPELPSMLLLAP